ncbi:MAG: hypothetical protein WCT23_08890 [Candidatus Neomarinimicrobiota bacterium]
MKNTIKTSLSIITAIFLLSCSGNMELPDNNSGTNAGINNNPNKFSRITPDWTFSELELQTPLDAFSSKDGRIYIADSAAHSIRVIRPSGEVESGIYDVLKDLDISPTSVCLDARFNVYYTDDKDIIYFWPQFVATIGIEGIITERDYKVGGDTLRMTPLEGLSDNYSPIPGTELVDTSQKAAIDSMMNPRVFYDPSSELNKKGLIDPVSKEVLIAGDPIYAAQNKSYVALAPADRGNMAIYAADAINDYILKIKLVPTVLVRLKNGQNVWQYIGMLDKSDVSDGFIAKPGTGSGTVSKPISMTSDNGGNVYYTQTGEYFSVHKLLSPSYSTAFLVGIDDIMELGEYGYARDIAVSTDNSIFVLDTLDRDVKLYSPQGDFIKSIVVREEWMKISDSSYVGDSLVVKDTLVLQQYPDLLLNPMALTFYNEVLYTFDNGNGKVLRFTKVDDVVIGDPDRED